MKALSFPAPLLWPVLACAALAPLAAAPPELRDLLRDGLYKEEVNHDPDGAAKAYQDLLARNNEQRTFAATAQFRLAEVRRKQGRKDEAVAAYRELLSRYPEAVTEGKLAQENLIALGAGDAPAAPDAIPPQGDDACLAELQAMQRKAPDTLGQEENYRKAIGQGYAKSLSFLLENAPPSGEVEALLLAVDSGSLEMVKLIMARKVRLSERERRTALALAAAKNQFFIAQELLSQGIDVNGCPEFATRRMPDEVRRSPGGEKALPIHMITGTALTTAISFGHEKVVDLLLKAGPDVNVRDSNWGYTALQAAILTKNPARVKELLSRGADPDIVSDHGESGYPGYSKWQALDFAIASGNEEIIRLLAQAGGTLMDPRSLLTGDSRENPTGVSPLLQVLLEGGVKPASLPAPDRLVGLGSLEQVRMLLDKGLDPSWNDGNQNLLRAAVIYRRTEIAGLLMNAGAKAVSMDENKETLLEMAAKKEASPELLNLLIDHGARMEEGWEDTAYIAEPGVPRVTPKNYQLSAGVRSVLFRRLLLPELTDLPEVRLITQKYNGTRIEVLREKSASSQPESLEQLLVARESTFSWQAKTGMPGPVLVTIWRKDATGQRTAIEADLRSDAPLPDLAWGDVVEMSYLPEERTILGMEGIPYPTPIPADLVWKMRQRIAIPVSVEMDGESRDLTVRGSLVTFDPTQPEVPLMGAAQLARLISRQKPDRSAPESLTVVREGWPEIKVLTSVNAADFALRKGDRLKWQMQDMPKQGGQRAEIRVCSPGLPFMVSFSESLSTYPLELRLKPTPISHPTMPTLLQAVAMVYGRDTGELKSTETRKVPASTAELAAWLPRGLEGEVPSVLRHPDLAHLRIRRKGSDGVEKIIEVDLQKAADTLSRTATAEEARKTDLLLIPGDLVELPVLPGSAGKPWAGFSPEQGALLERALSGSIQITDDKGQISLLPLHYQPPRFVPTLAGLVALPAAEGTASLSLEDVLPGGIYSASSADGNFPSMEAGRILLSERFQLTRIGSAPPVGPPVPPAAPPSLGSRPMVREPRSR